MCQPTVKLVGGLEAENIQTAGRARAFSLTNQNQPLVGDRKFYVETAIVPGDRVAFNFPGSDSTNSGVVSNFQVINGEWQPVVTYGTPDGSKRRTSIGPTDGDMTVIDTIRLPAIHAPPVTPESGMDMSGTGSDFMY